MGETDIKSKSFRDLRRTPPHKLILLAQGEGTILTHYRKPVARLVSLDHGDHEPAPSAPQISLGQLRSLPAHSLILLAQQRATLTHYRQPVALLAPF